MTKTNLKAVELPTAARDRLRAIGVAPRADAERQTANVNTPANAALPEGTPAEQLGALHSAFAQFRAANDERLAQIERGREDVVTREETDRLNEEVGRLQGRIDAHNARLEGLALNGGGGERSGVRSGLIERFHNAEYSQAYGGFLRRGGEAQEAALASMANGLPMAAIVGTSDAAGGYVAPIEWNRQIMDELRNLVGMRRLARVETISGSGFQDLYPSGLPARGWVGEADARPSTATPTFSALTFNAEEQYANPGISQRMLDDAVIDIEAWLAGKIAEAFAIDENAAFVTGDGDDKPFGILDYVTGEASAAKHPFGAIAKVISGGATTLTYDGLINLVHELPSQYAANASVAMNRLTMGAVRKIKDTDGYPIWQPSLALGDPSTVLGLPNVELSDLPNVGAGTFPVIVGDFMRGYLIVDRLGIRVLRDPYTNKPYVQFYTTKRVGGGVRDPKAFRVQEVAAS
jgi:HK97 family phage major capsid protein